MASADGTAGGRRRGGARGAGRRERAVAAMNLMGRQEKKAFLAQQLFAMAVEYLYGRNGVAKDEKSGVELLKAAAHAGLAEAQVKLGFAYQNAKFGVERDDEEGAEWYRRAADQGKARAQFNLGFCYNKGKGVDKDFVEAVRLYRLSAEQGYVSAQFNLGLCYNKGEGVDQSYEEAQRWNRRAVDQGHADAQNNLAVLYRDGTGVKLDYTEAARLFQLAADQDHKIAQKCLGLLYFEGHGVQRNCDTALQWLRRSGSTDRRVSDAIAEIEKSARKLLGKRLEMQRTMIEAGESVFGQLEDGTGDCALHVAARQLQPDAVALFFDHPSFDDLLLRANTAGELPRDVVSAGNPGKAQSREALALRSILSVTRRSRASCVLWCFEMLRVSAPERLVACIPRDIVYWEIVKHILPPRAPGSLQCCVATLLHSPVAWMRPCLVIAPPIEPQPVSPAEQTQTQYANLFAAAISPVARLFWGVFAVQQQQQQQQQQGSAAFRATLAPQLQQQEQAQPSTATLETAESSGRGTKRALEETGVVVIDVNHVNEGQEDDVADDELGETEDLEPASKRARS